MLDPCCPSCSRQIKLFGAEWQAQRASRRKVCPFCGVALRAEWKASTFLLWCCGFLALSLVAGILFGAHAAALLFVSAFIVPLVTSLHLYRDA